MVKYPILTAFLSASVISLFQSFLLRTAPHYLNAFLTGYNLGQNKWKIWNPPSAPSDGKMARFGFCVASSLIWWGGGGGRDGGLLFHFILSKIVVPDPHKKDPSRRKRERVGRILDSYQTLHRGKKFTQNSLLWH